jgi:hypothetical protein
MNLWSCSGCGQDVATYRTACHHSQWRQPSTLTCHPSVWRHGPPHIGRQQWWTAGKHATTATDGKCFRHTLWRHVPRVGSGCSRHTRGGLFCHLYAHVVLFVNLLGRVVLCAKNSMYIYVNSFTVLSLDKLLSLWNNNANSWLLILNWYVSSKERWSSKPIWLCLLIGNASSPLHLRWPLDPRGVADHGPSLVGLLGIFSVFFENKVLPTISLLQQYV